MEFQMVERNRKGSSQLPLVATDESFFPALWKNRFTGSDLVDTAKREDRKIHTEPASARPSSLWNLGCDSRHERPNSILKMEFPEPWHSRPTAQWPRLAKAIRRLNRMRLRRGLAIKHYPARPVLAQRFEGPTAERFQKIRDKLPMQWGGLPMHPHPAATLDEAIASVPISTKAKSCKTRSSP
jgi:hypothetical protein